MYRHTMLLLNNVIRNGSTNIDVVAVMALAIFAGSGDHYEAEVEVVSIIIPQSVT